ncbi:MAG: TauD/TfdA family dioxygenase [Sandaracinaceae bacterium]|nr:TauD/TfdA family dioxygenase [Sandaracinaceae bacterium]
MKTRALSPFGLLVEAAEGTAFDTIPTETLEGWLRAHRVVVLRGIAGPKKAELPARARRLGPLQAWSFGSVHELVPDPQAENYLYTRREVPLHWDGAFARSPHYLFFHCVEAPGLDAGGATTFVDTTRVWEKADTPTRDRWRALRFRYSTDAVAHYGGTFTQKLVVQHPTDGGTVLRFAEPVDDLNPVSVDVVGLDPLAAAQVITELRAALYAPDVLLEHTWRTGDVVIADNHALLHGRRAFATDAPRHIRRVNVHDRTPRTLLCDVVDSLTIRRPEFMVAEIPILLIAALTATHGAWAPLASGRFAAVAILFFLLFHFGDMINCLADRELDAVYKTRLSEAVYGLGVANVRAQITLTVLAALGLGGALAWTLGRVEIVGLVAVGLVLGGQYSTRPLWLKSRGLAQIVTLWGVIFVGPMLLVASVMGERVLDARWALFFGLYGAMQQGIVLVNTAEDLPEDRASGIRTSAIVLGLRGAVWTACALVIAGGGGVLALLAHDGARLALAPLALAWLWVSLELARLGARVHGAPDEREALRRLRPRARRVPIWITATAWTALATVSLSP